MDMEITIIVMLAVIALEAAALLLMQRTLNKCHTALHMKQVEADVYRGMWNSTEHPIPFELVEWGKEEK